MKTLVYFIRHGAEIKVGITSDLTSRLATIRRDGRRGAEMVAAVYGNHALERALHRKLRQHALGGEWFRDCRDVQAAIQNTINNFKVADVDLPLRRNNSVLSEIAKLLWPVKTAAELAALVGCCERAAEHWIGGTHDWSGDAVSALTIEILKRHSTRSIRVAKKS